MDNATSRCLTNEFKRKRHLRTANPFCRICGKSTLWSNYHRHHCDLRKYSDDQIFICEDCHNEVHAMLREYPAIPAAIPESRHRLIHMARGQMTIARLMLKKWGEVEDWLLSQIDLPPLMNGASDSGGLEEPSETSDAMARLEARFGISDGEAGE